MVRLVHNRHCLPGQSLIQEEQYLTVLRIVFLV
jgi:hypothetical protein